LVVLTPPSAGSQLYSERIPGQCRTDIVRRSIRIFTTPTPGHQGYVGLGGRAG
jgi:hypothetical protein